MKGLEDYGIRSSQWMPVNGDYQINKWFLTDNWQSMPRSLKIYIATACQFIQWSCHPFPGRLNKIYWLFGHTWTQFMKITLLHWVSENKALLVTQLSHTMVTDQKSLADSGVIQPVAAFQVQPAHLLFNVLFKKNYISI